ncbi:MAG: hypothetical protein ABFD97_12350 [Syntrophobacter sp.]
MTTCSQGTIERLRQFSATGRRIRGVVFASLAATALVAAAGVAEANTAPGGLADRDRILIGSPVLSRSSDTAGIQMTEVQRPRCRLLLADKIETRDQIEYTTDPEATRAFEDARRHEMEKEDRAWKMLDDMQIYHLPRDKSHRNTNEDRRQ